MGTLRPGDPFRACASRRVVFIFVSECRNRRSDTLTEDSAAKTTTGKCLESPGHSVVTDVSVSDPPQQPRRGPPTVDEGVPFLSGVLYSTWAPIHFHCLGLVSCGLRRLSCHRPEGFSVVTDFCESSWIVVRTKTKIKFEVMFGPLSTVKGHKTRATRGGKAYRACDVPRPTSKGSPRLLGQLH